MQILALIVLNIVYPIGTCPVNRFCQVMEKPAAGPSSLIIKFLANILIS